MKGFGTTKYFSTVGWMLRYFIPFHSATGILFIKVLISTSLISFPLPLFHSHFVVFLIYPWKYKSTTKVRKKSNSSKK
jgi:hypothetical protein